MAHKKKEPSKAEKWGAQYVNAKLVVQATSPLVQATVGSLVAGQGVAGIRSNLKYVFTGGGLMPTLEGEVSALAQRWGDKKIGQAGALSRNSLTAIASELVPLAHVWGGSHTVQAAYDTAIAATTGYHPAGATFVPQDVIPYATAKYGLGLARKVLTGSGMAAPISKALGAFGVSL